MFILQILSVCQTKRSRAAPLAGIRNRLPRALPLPDTVLDCEYGCHSQQGILFRGRNHRFSRRPTQM